MIEADKTIVIFGACSSIGRSTCLALARKGYRIYLAGRSLEDLERNALDIQMYTGKKPGYGFFDLENSSSHQTFLQQALSECGEIQGFCMLCGMLPPEKQCALEAEEQKEIIHRNFVDLCSILSLCADYLEARQRGFLVALSSAFADFGTRDAYVYQASKAALNIYLEGIRDRMALKDIRVLTIKLGLVDTAGSFGFRRSHLKVPPSYIGEHITQILNCSGRTFYLPWFWNIRRFLPRRTCNFFS